MLNKIIWKKFYIKFVIDFSYKHPDSCLLVNLRSSSAAIEFNLFIYGKVVSKMGISIYLEEVRINFSRQPAGERAAVKDLQWILNGNLKVSLFQ